MKGELFATFEHFVRKSVFITSEVLERFFKFYEVSAQMTIKSILCCFANVQEKAKSNVLYHLTQSKYNEK